MGACSLETIRRQVDREGARYGLHAVVSGDKVYAAEWVPVVQTKPHGIGIVSRVERLVCSIDEQHPFPAVLLNRQSRARFTANEMRMARDAALKKPGLAVKAALKEEFTARMRRVMRGRVQVSVPGKKG